MTEENIAYKVVFNRKSFITSLGGKFSLDYQPGAVVKAPEGTLGIFCFKDRNSAWRFAYGDRGSTNGTLIKVIKVRPIGKCFTPFEVSLGISDIGLMNFYDSDSCYKNSTSTRIIDGTICYPAVEVLE
jgi:hypothetical protein